MATGEIKFSQLPTGSAIQDADFAPWVQSGNNVKQPASASLTYMQDKLQSSAKYVYVATNGVDSPGRGFVNNPYATPDYAISQINDPSNIYIVNVVGNYTITDLILKPNILIYLNNYQLTVTNSVVLDVSWSGVGGFCAIRESSGINFPASVNLDFDSIGASFAVFYFLDNITNSATSFTINGSLSGATITQIGNDFGFSSEFDYTIINCYGAIANGATGDINITNTSDSTGGNYSLLNLTELGNVTISTSSNSGLALFHESCKVIGNAIYQTTGAGNLNVGAKALTYLGGAPKLDNGIGGGQVNFNIDLLEQFPILLNGATFTPSRIGESINANFSPVNYVPVDSSVTGHLEGIDNTFPDYFLIANELSEINGDPTEARANLGFASGVFTANTDSDYTLSNPASNILYIDMPTPGHIIKLWPIEVPRGIVDGQFVQIYVADTSQSVTIQDSNGNNIIILNPGDRYLAEPIGYILSPITGWYFITASSGGNQDMQSTYNFGSTVNLADSQPVIFSSGSSYGTPQNLMIFYSPAYFSAPPVNYVIGMSFTVQKAGIISSLCYANAAFSSGTREVGLWSYTTSTTGTLLATANVSKSDPLDTQTNQWRCTAITPVTVSVGVRYVVAELNPTTDKWLGYQYSSPPWAIIDGQSQVDYANPTLVYPPIIDSLAPAQWGNANLLFQDGSGDESFLINDSVSNPNTIFQINSTARASHPIPSMTQTQFNAISSPGDGDLAYVTDNHIFEYFNGTSQQTLLNVDNVIAGSNITINNNGDGSITVDSVGSVASGGGSAVFHISSGATTTFSNSSYKILNMTVSGSTSTNINVNNDGSFQIIDGGQYDFEYVISGRSSSTQNEFGFEIGKNGVPQTASLVVYSVPTAPGNAGDSLVLKYSFNLNPGDIIQPYIANLNSLSNNFIAQQLIGKASQDLASSSTLQQNYNNGDGTIQGNLNSKPFEIKNSGGTPILSDTENSLEITGNLNLNTSNYSLKLNVLTDVQFDAQSPVQGSVAFSTDKESLIFFDGMLDQWVATRSWVTSNFSIPYTEVSGTSQSMSVNNEYTANNGSLVTLTLPTTATIGDVIIVNGKGAGGWKVAQNASQIIHLGSGATTTGTGGSLASTNQWDNLRLKCVTTNTTWIVQGSPQGNITVV